MSFKDVLGIVELFITQAKEEFNVLTVPTYYLIDPKGNVFKSPAGKPQDIEPVFLDIKRKP